MDNLDKKSFESILSMDCPLVRGLSPVRPRSVHTQVWVTYSQKLDSKLSLLVYILMDYLLPSY